MQSNSPKSVPFQVRQLSGLLFAAVLISGCAQAGEKGSSDAGAAFGASPRVADRAPGDPAAAGPQEPLRLTACEPSGNGRDYVVGPGAGQLPSLDRVPWDRLDAGDTVRITYSATPYRGKILASARGTEKAPLRICGIKGPNGERPIVDGSEAIARQGLGYTSPRVDNIQETRAVVMVDRLGSEGWKDYPTYIQIDGLEIRGANSRNTFTNSFGNRQRYVDFGACVWIERGHHIVIADNEIHDCSQGLFSRSLNDGDFVVTRDLRIAGNYIHGNGVVGNFTTHNAYTQSIGVLYEFNRFGPPREGALGNAIKDRSAGTIVRYNRIEEGAHSIDLVEAEDFESAIADPSYRTTYVYGNQIIKNGETGSFIHYGGDHYECCEQSFRRGVLYFYHNTIQATGKGAYMFQVSTTLERAEVWNNVFAYATTVEFPSMRQTSEVDKAYTPGGIVNLGRNWISTRWADSDPYHPVPGTLAGGGNMIVGATWPIDRQTFAPLTGSAIIDAAQAAPSGAELGVHADVNWQLDPTFKPQPRVVKGAAADIGAIER